MSGWYEPSGPISMSVNDINLHGWYRDIPSQHEGLQGLFQEDVEEDQSWDGF